MPPTLHLRITRLVLAVTATLLLLSALLWVHGSRQSIHEEVEAANRVAEQWLRVLATGAAASEHPQALLSQLAAVGRLRANALRVLDGQQALLYQSPPSPYKAGRGAPEWFSRLLDPHLPPRLIQAGGLQLELTPDPSRAILDAWDDLAQLALGALALLVLLGLTLKLALARTLAPLDSFAAALDSTAAGRFDHRLPAQATRELEQLAQAYNAMGENLAESLRQNAQLEVRQLLDAELTEHLQAERRLLARELHDELGQGITAVRAIAGAIAQRSEIEEQAHFHGSAQAILAMTSQMQAGVRLILQRLRSPGDGQPVQQLLADHAQQWRQAHPELDLALHLEPLPATLPPEYQQCLLRLLQESLTNIARHAHASRVEVRLARENQSLTLSISDDGVGCQHPPGAWHFGLRGMAERVAEWSGQFQLETPASGGTRIRASLPWPERRKEEHHVLP